MYELTGVIRFTPISQCEDMVVQSTLSAPDFAAAHEAAHDLMKTLMHTHAAESGLTIELQLRNQQDHESVQLIYAGPVRASVDQPRLTATH